VLDRPSSQPGSNIHTPKVVFVAVVAVLFGGEVSNSYYFLYEQNLKKLFFLSV